MAAHDRIVVVELQGRLGNQLFQFATGYSLALGREAGLRIAAWRVPPADRLLPALVGALAREPTRAELLRVGVWSEDLPGAPLLRGLTFRAARAVRRARGATPPSFVVWEDTGRFRPELLTQDLPVRLVGHPQSERYFADHAAEVAAAIALPTVPDPGAGDHPTVAVSFRRGDYNTTGWALPLDYYDRALARVAEEVGDATFVLFGDDPAFVELVASRVAAHGPVVDGTVLAPDPVGQLATMARCDHHVLANSSFAWWGAWLAEQRHATRTVVVAPAEFAGPDRIPSRWSVLETGIEAF